MVSTRQMSSVGGGSGSGETAGPSNSEATAAVPRVTRHSSALLPGGSSPHTATASKCVSLIPAPKTYTTNMLDLPEEVIEKIFSYIGFKSVSQLRMVTIFHDLKLLTSPVRDQVINITLPNFNFSLDLEYWIFHLECKKKIFTIKTNSNNKHFCVIKKIKCRLKVCYLWAYCQLWSWIF